MKEINKTLLNRVLLISSKPCCNLLQHHVPKIHCVYKYRWRCSLFVIKIHAQLLILLCPQCNNSMDLLSNSYFIATLSVISTLLALHQFLFRKTKKKYPPIVGTIFNQLLNFNRIHHYTTDLARKHKTYRFLSPSRNKIYTSDPENVEYILKTNFDNFGKVSLSTP